MRGIRLTRIGVGQTVFEDGDKSIRKWLAPNSPLATPSSPSVRQDLPDDNVVERPGTSGSPTTCA